MRNSMDQYTTVNGCSIRYREAGKGPLLFLVHGIAGFLEEWNSVVEILSEYYRVIALDLPGHGLSDKPEISYTINQLSGFLRDFIISFSSGKIYLAGHSLGGAICLNLVIQTPNLVERLVLVNSVFEKIPFSIRLGTFRFIPRLVKKVPQWMVESSSRKSIHKKELITSELNDRAYQYINTPGNLEAMFSIMQSNINLSGLDINYLSQYKEGMKDINIPVLILYGDQDKIIPDINSKLLHRYLSNSECISVKNCGHGLHYESYEAFCKEVLTFFKIHLSP